MMEWYICLHMAVWLLGVSALLLNRSSGAFVGFNYGTQLSVVPSAKQVVNLLMAQHVTNIRLYDANSSILQALAGTGIQIIVSVPNNQLLSVGESNSSAANWVRNNVIAYLPSTNITGICVGTEVLTSYPNAALVLVPAMKFLHSALVAANLDQQVKISTPFSTSIIMDSFPPSQAYFNKSWNGILQPMLDFLSQTGSYFMLNVYSYDIFKNSNGVISLDYALLNPLSASNVVVDSNTLLSYSGLFDAVLDSAIFAMAQLNHTDIPLVVSEAGWPWNGDSTDTDATLENASIFNSNLIRHIVNNTGTPKRPRAVINTFLFELFNEDLRSGSPTIKNYGLFNSSNLLPVYQLRLTGSGSLLSNDTTNTLYCVAKPGIDNDALQIALDWACGPGHADCGAILPGGLCYIPDTVPAHASYAFDSYFQKNNRADDSCDFTGAAIITTTNPSYNTCVYPGSINFAVIANITTTNTSTGSGNKSTSSSGYLDLSYVHIIFTFASLFLVMVVTAQF